MEVSEIRRLNAIYLVDKKLGKSTLIKKLGYPDANYLNQITGGHLNMGSRTARKFECSLALDNGWMDAPHPDLWGTDADEIAQYMMRIFPTLSSADLSLIIDKALKVIRSREE